MPTRQGSSRTVRGGNPNDPLFVKLPDGASTTGGLTDFELRASPVPVDTGLLQPTTPLDTQPVSAESLPLPAGAATAAKQLPDNHQVSVSNFPAQTGLTDAQLRATPVPVNTGLLQGTTPADTQPVSATSLPLPTGAATAAKQLPDNHFVRLSNVLVPNEYDQIDLSYTGTNVTGVVYKKLGVTVATLTLSYTGENLTSVVRA